jgi:hypothetical protein
MVTQARAQWILTAAVLAAITGAATPLAAQPTGSGDEKAAPSDAKVPGPPAPPPVSEAAPATDARGAPVARLHHDPRSTARPHEPLEIRAAVDHPQVLRGASVVYRSPNGALRVAPFARSPAGGYVAVVPASDVIPPALAYTIELEHLDGSRSSAFASRAEMQPIQILEDEMDARERAQLERLGGRRSVASVSTDLVSFGETSGKRAIPCAPGGSGCRPGESKEPVGINDQYWKVEAGYTYRFLRTVAEFSLRGGVVRGTSLVELEEYDEERYEVGLNYAAPSLRFRLADAWHLEAELLTSVTEVGFSVGTGGALLIGDPYGSRLTLGAQTIGVAEGTYFGTRLYSRMDIAANERFTIAPIIEATDMPHADAFGVRLLAEASAAVGGGFGVALRGGYQARRSASGGVGLGGTASLAF